MRYSSRTPLISLLVAIAALEIVVAARPLRAQPFQQRIAPFTVERGDGSAYRNPFSGGLLQPRIGVRDADADGRPDIFTLNPDNRLRLYRNEGSFRFARVFPSPFDGAKVRSWFRFADIDADGDDDLFTSGPLSEVFLYRNSGTQKEPVYPALADTLKRGDTTIFTQQETVPSLVDIDADGDLDLFSGNIDGSISYYRNIGTAQQARFTFITAFYQGILVVSNGTVRKEKAPRAIAKHGASVLDFADTDRDGDLDLLFGDFFTEKLLLFHNDGTPSQALFSMNRLDTAFRPDGDDVTSTGFNQPVISDLDGDGDLDALIASLYPLSPEQPLVLYENISEGSAKPLVMRRRAIDLTSEIDLGTFSAPAIIDDATRRGVLIGMSDGTITYLRDATAGGQTIWRHEGRFGTLPALFQAVPTAGDLDGDGEAEVIVGDANDGRIRMFRFEGNQLAPVPWQLDTFRVNQYAAPSLADIDRDDDLDLFVGAGNGLLVFFENVGGRSAPRFERKTPPAPFNTLDVGSSSTITFHDLEGDGDLDAIVGGRARSDASTGFLRFYLRSDGSFVQSPSYPDLATDRNPVPMLLSLPEGRFLFTGTQAGGLLAYFDSSSLSSSVRDRWEGENRPIVAPNILLGGENLLRIEWNIPHPTASLLVTDLLGDVVLRGEIPEGSGTTVIPLTDLPSGAYFVTIDGRLVERIILLP